MILEEYNQDLQTHHLSEPQWRWGSTWTDEKLDAFEKYVKAYLTILNNFKRQFGWRTVYIDAFVGSGSCGEEDLTGNDGSVSLSSTLTLSRISPLTIPIGELPNGS